jgi:ABC-type dipeptide/oligopeptide/nickel transport system permease component
MIWLNLSLIALTVSLALPAVFSGSERIWPRVRFLAVLAFQVSGILLLSWLLVSGAPAQPGPPTSGPPPDAANIAQTAITAALRSLALLATTVIWATCSGLGAAFLITASRNRGWLAIIPVVTVLWVLPTFLFAVGVQELQFLIYNAIGTPVGGAYGTGSALQILWAAVVLGVRPAAYIFRQARVTLDLEETADHVRAARARGLPWSRIAARHIFRPAAATIASGWLSSFRLMIGSLPLVEFFFAYPGFGQLLVLSLGVGYGDNPSQPQPQLAIALVVTMAVVLVLIETVVGMLQTRLDPRLRDLQLEEA